MLLGWRGTPTHVFSPLLTHTRTSRMKSLSQPQPQPPEPQKPRLGCGRELSSPVHADKAPLQRQQARQQSIQQQLYNNSRNNAVINGSPHIRSTIPTKVMQSAMVHKNDEVSESAAAAAPRVPEAPATLRPRAFLSCPSSATNPAAKISAATSSTATSSITTVETTQSSTALPIFAPPFLQR